jgi:hypothetical protein
MHLDFQRRRRLAYFGMAGGLCTAAICFAQVQAEEFHIEQQGVACEGSADALEQLKAEAKKVGLVYDESISGARTFVSFSEKTLRDNPAAAKAIFTDLYAPHHAVAMKALQCGVMERPVGTSEPR